ncbi:head-tail connector protein [Gilvimarinus agarilyticus]|uniref:head-tail connector protein n=1 Tax=Gilvimarinus agarilyticus TaxID=679259 RepID=UPI00059F07DE|nr:hypothetical protein [Gilvimarinus agarilyticus]
MHLVKQSVADVQPITLDDIKAQTNVTHSLDDAYLTACAAQGLDQVASDTNRAMVDTTWTLTGAGFTPVIKLPRPPLIEVVSIKYIDTAGTEQTLPEADYQITISDVATFIQPAAGKQWPTIQRGNANAVTVLYRAGYVQSDGEGGTTGNLPTQARQAALLWAAHLYEFREAVTTGQTYQLPSYRALIAPLEVDLI